MNLKQYKSSSFYGKIEGLVHKANSLRLHNETPTDIALSEVIQMEHSMDMDSFYEAIGVDPNFDTVSNIVTTPDRDVRWLIPEIFRDALVLGYRKGPIWPNLIAMEEQVSGLQQIVPYLNMSDALPRRVGEGETIPLGELSYGSKRFDIHKFGRGIKLTDEVSRYVSLAVISIYLQDFGIKMGHGVDALAIDTLINGEAGNSGESAPIVGVESPLPAPGVGLTFKDILKVWFRLAVLGRNPSVMLGAEAMAIDVFLMPEFNRRVLGGANPDGKPEYSLNMNVLLPQGANFFLHGLVPANQLMILDPTAALLKMNAQPMMVESERIVSNQTTATYASFTLGFAKMFTEACVLINQAVDFTNNGFPSGMDPYSRVQVDMDRK